MVGRGGAGLNLGGGAIGTVSERSYLFAVSLNSNKGTHLSSRDFGNDGDRLGAWSVDDLAMDSLENLYLVGW